MRWVLAGLAVALAGCQACRSQVAVTYKHRDAEVTVYLER